jgi:hypothetical protein
VVGPEAGLWEDLLAPSDPLRVQAPRSKVAHLWAGGGYSICGRSVDGAQLAPEGLPLCRDCARSVRRAAEEVPRG